MYFLVTLVLWNLEILKSTFKVTPLRNLFENAE